MFWPNWSACWRPCFKPVHHLAGLPTDRPAPRQAQNVGRICYLALTVRRKRRVANTLYKTDRLHHKFGAFHAYLDPGTSMRGTPLLLKLAPMMLADSASVMTTLVAVTTPVLLKATPYSSNHRC